MSSRLRWLGLVVFLSLLLSACDPAEIKNVPKAVAEARPGGSIAIGLTEPQSIEPSSASLFEPSGDLVVRTMCDTLIHSDPVTGEPRAGLAEAWQVLDSGQRFVVRLRKGARFHNGKEVRGEDAIFALWRLASQEFASPSASLLEPIVGFREVHGEEEPSDPLYKTQLRGVRLLENYSFQIELDRPQADFIRVLGHPATSPIPKQLATADPDGFAKRPICAGPYKISGTWNPDQESIKLVRFVDYYASNAAHSRGGSGYLNSIEFRILRTREEEADAFRSGIVHVAHVPSSRLNEARIAGPSFISSPAPSLDYVGLPVRMEPFDRSDVRLALSRSLDRQAISDSLFGGTRVAASSFIPPGLGALHRAESCDSAPVRGGTANVEGLPASVKAYVNDEFQNREVMEAVARQWKEKLGLSVELVTMPWQEYSAKASQPSGFDGPFRMSWAAQYPSADAFLSPLFHSINIGRTNLTGFASQQFDLDLEQIAREAPTEEDQRVEYLRLEDQLCSDMPIIPLLYGAKYQLVDLNKYGSAVGEVVDRFSSQVVLREMYAKPV